MAKQSKTRFTMAPEDRQKLLTIYEREMKKRYNKQEAMAEIIGISVANLRFCVRDGRTSARTLSAVLEALGVPKSDDLYLKYVHNKPIPDENSEKHKDSRPLTAVWTRAFSYFGWKMVGGACLAILIVITVFTFGQHARRNQEARALLVALQDKPELTIQAAKREPATLNTLSRLLDDGLNPDLRTGSGTLLATAIEVGAVEVVLELLRAGASPHAFQDLSLVRTRTPLFLFPLHAVAVSDNFSGEDKKRILSAMIDSRVVHFRPFSTEQIYHETPDRVRDLFDRFYTKLDTDLNGYTTHPRKEVPLSCAFQRDTTYCDKMSRLSGKDWCSIQKEVPAVINVTSTDISSLGVIYVQELISLSDTSSYFYVSHLVGRSSLHGVLEVTADSDLFYLHLWGRASGGGVGEWVGSCSGERQGECFKTWRIKRTSKTKATVAEYYVADLIPTCQPQDVTPIGNDNFDFYQSPK